MQSTKVEILRLLKRGGPASVDDIAAHLRLAGMTIRQHLLALERDALVHVCDARRRGSGRPCRLYELSVQGDAMFPRGFDALARGILHEVALLDPSDVAELAPDQKVALVLGRYAERVAAEHLDEVRRYDLPARVSRVTAILSQMSGFVETEHREGGLAIRDYNCAYRKLASIGPQLCAWHERILTVLLGCDVCWEPEQRADCCSAFVALPATSEGTHGLAAATSIHHFAERSIRVS